MKFIIRISLPDQTIDIDVDDRFGDGTEFHLMDCLQAHGIDPNEVIKKGGSLSFGALFPDRFDIFHTLK